MVPYASGVLVELGGSSYILTASHVIEDWPHKTRLFIEIKDGYISVAGKGCGTELVNGGKVDIAYIKLKDELTLVLKQCYKFLSIDKFLYQEKLLDEANYCAFGYPVNNPKNSKLKTIGAGYYVRPAPDKAFEHYEFDPLTHYVLEFRGKATNIETGKMEKIKVAHYGLSGGGLWYTTIQLKGDKLISKAYLIGIMAEFRKGKYECLIANRIEVLLATLQNNEGLKLKKGTFKKG